MTLTIDVQTNDTSHHSPEESEFFNWANTTLTAAAYSKDAEISFTVMSSEEITQINQAYRNKNTPTNVLSFPAELHTVIELPLLGDILLCGEIIEKEATEQKKTLQAHWAHMTVHGVLHLIGYDHIEEQDAIIMESLEIQVMKQLGYNNPYFIEEN